MRKLSLLTVVLLAISVFAFAQHVPLGMKYQAVARDLKGNVLGNQSISIRVNLYSQATGLPVYHYSETHDVITNSLGLFSMVIGDGKTDKGGFDKIPWSTEDIWMEVSLKDKIKNDYVTISSSKLLAVPYAFHAETASALSGNSTHTGNIAAKGPAGGSNGDNWAIVGNINTDSTNKLGTI
jgi:hypothetical protein